MPSRIQPTMETHYHTLGVKRDATSEEIKRAYRRLAIQTHPDKNPELKDGQAFLKIKHAFDVLSEPTKRAQYDVLLAHATRPRTLAERNAEMKAAAAELKRRLEEMRMRKGELQKRRIQKMASESFARRKEEWERHMADID